MGRNGWLRRPGRLRGLSRMPFGSQTSSPPHNLAQANSIRRRGVCLLSIKKIALPDKNFVSACQHMVSIKVKGVFLVEHYSTYEKQNRTKPEETDEDPTDK